MVYLGSRFYGRVHGYAGEYAVTFSVLTRPLGGTSLIPAYYSHPESTPFKITVDDDKTDLVYELEKL